MQEFNTSAFKMIEKIGEGAYGCVFRAETKTLPVQTVAIKVTKFGREDEGLPSTTLREIGILQTLRHPNIVNLLGFCLENGETENSIKLVFEYLNEDLGKYIRRKGRLEVAEYRKIMLQIAKGVRHMHKNGIYHRDLKPQNILRSHKGEIKLADFGLSRVIINPSRTHSKQIETLWYRSIELLLGSKHYDSGVDIWSMGCILYEMAEGKVLFKGDSEISQIFCIFGVMGTPHCSEWPSVQTLPHFKKSFPKMHPKLKDFENLPPDGVDLLVKLLEMDPKKRISIDDVLNHKFLKYH